MDIVEVEWLDATTCPHNTHSLEEAQVHAGACAKTVGYVLKEDDEIIVLAMTHFYDTPLPPTEVAEEGYKFIWSIPKGCIKEIKRIKDR